MTGFSWRMIVAAAALAALPATAQQVSFSDPAGDDNGPGGYTYPTDAVYRAGSFDLTKFEMNAKGGKAEFAVTFNTNLDDPWRMGVGFATQMVFIFIDTDHKEGSGMVDAPPGLNIQFVPKDAWDKLVILSPQTFARVNQEVESKAGSMKGSIVVPNRVRGAGQKITASVSLADLGEGDPTTWGYQVVIQSNEGFPADNDLLTRKVNEFEGQHRFGGGTDGDCDPHVIDILAGNGKGEASETEAQHKMLAYECNADGSSKTKATLTMVYPSK
jgi:carbohydrate-binding DOMON domain-containing protein